MHSSSDLRGWDAAFVDGARCGCRHFPPGATPPPLRYPHQALPYSMMVPRRGEVNNLLVPVAVSASHIAYNAVRMEPTWMHALLFAACVNLRVDASCIAH
jgi:hypothetical protein